MLARNGLRPYRYLVTTDDTLVMASEAGVLDVPPEKVVFKDRIRPGRMFLLDPDQGGLVDDATIKSDLAGRHPYGTWLEANLVELGTLRTAGASNVAPLGSEDLARLQRAFGYTQDFMRLLLTLMSSIFSESK